MMLRATLFALIASAAFSAQARAAPVTLRGEMSVAAVDRAIRSLRTAGAAPVLVVRSAGGPQEAALKLADHVRSNRVTVEVDGYCVALCAQTVFAAAAVRRVRPGSIVAFHNDIVAGVSILEGRGLTPAAPIAAVAARDLAAYKRWGFDPASLFDQFSGLAPVCVGLAEVPSTVYTAQAQLWVPPKGWIQQRFGGAISGYWPSSQSEANRAAASLIREIPSQNRLRYGAAEPWSTAKRRLLASPCRSGPPAAKSSLKAV